MSVCSSKSQKNSKQQPYFTFSCGLNVQAANILHTLILRGRLSYRGTQYKSMLDDSFVLIYVFCTRFPGWIFNCLYIVSALHCSCISSLFFLVANYAIQILLSPLLLLILRFFLFICRLWFYDTIFQTQFPLSNPHLLFSPHPPMLMH